MCRLENRHAGHIIDVGSGGDSDTADAGCKRIGNIIAVQIHRGDHVIFRGTCQNLLEECVTDTVFDQDLAFRRFPVAFGSNGDLIREFAFCELVSPVLESALGEFREYRTAIRFPRKCPLYFHGTRPYRSIRDS